MGNGEIGTVLKPKNPIHDDFPWSHFASLGMHTLINQWELHPLSKAISLQEQLNVIKSPPTVKLNNHLFIIFTIYSKLPIIVNTYKAMN